jgi:hypothetical protein
VACEKEALPKVPPGGTGRGERRMASREPTLSVAEIVIQRNGVALLSCHADKLTDDDRQLWCGTGICLSARS